MNQGNKSTTPSETSWESVSFFSVLFPTEPEPGFAHQEAKELENRKRTLSKCGTYTARNVRQEQMNQESKSTTTSKI